MTDDVRARLEAILLIVEEPQSLVSLAAAVGSPVPAVRQAIEALVDDYDGKSGGPVRGFELREVGGGWRFYARAEYDRLMAESDATTDAEARVMKMADGGYRPAYNVQYTTATDSQINV